MDQRSAEREAALLAALLRPGTVAAQQQRWRALHRALEPVIRRAVSRTLKRYLHEVCDADIDDETGQVWLALVDAGLWRLRSFDATRGVPLDRFVGRVAANVTIDSLRRRKIRYLDAQAGAEAAVAPEVDRLEQIHEEAHRCDIARAALARLAPEERRFALAAFAEERPTTQLAAEHGVSPATIYTRRFRLRARLAQVARAVDSATGNQGLPLLATAR